MAIELNGIAYDTSERLAKLLEAIRQRQKQPDPFRIRVKWVSGEFKPAEGYIVTTSPQKLTEWDSEVSFPLLAWKSNSSRGVRLDPSLIASIEFASSDQKRKTKADVLYTRENNFIHSVCTEWLNSAQFLT